MRRLGLGHSLLVVLLALGTVKAQDTDNTQKSMRSLQAWLKKANSIKLERGVSGKLVGPGTDPEKPKANEPFTIADGANIAISKDSKKGDYIFLFRLFLIGPDEKVVSRKTQAWQIHFTGTIDVGVGWAVYDNVPAQKAGLYTLKSVLKVIEPEETEERKLDEKTVKVTVK